MGEHDSVLLPPHLNILRHGLDDDLVTLQTIKHEKFGDTLLNYCFYEAPMI